MCLAFTRSSIMLTFLLFFFLFVPLSHPWDASQKTHLLGIPLGSSLLRRARKPLAQWFLQLSMWWERELVVWRTGHTLSPPCCCPRVPSGAWRGGWRRGPERVLCLFTSSKIRIRGIALTPSFFPFEIFLAIVWFHLFVYTWKKWLTW